MRPQEIINRYPYQILKEYSELLSGKLKDILNNCLDQGIYPDRLELADLSPISKADDSSLKKNHRPVSVLNTISKLFEKLINKQLGAYIDNHLSQYICRYRKGYSTQYAIYSLLEK